MKIIKAKESDKILKAQIGSIKNNDDAIKEFLKFFNGYKFKEQLEHEEEDMMLFQYGSYDWQDGNGKEFKFDLTRQVEVPEEEEFLQLSLSLYYNSEEIGEIESFNCWSVDNKDLNEWQALIKETKGYKKSINLMPKRFEVNLNGTA